MVRMTVNHEELVGALDDTWRTLRRSAPELPAVTILAGGFRGPGVDPSAARRDVFVSTKTLIHGPVAVLSALGHDAAHLLADVRGVQDTSNRGRYHNRDFEALAAELGFHHVEPESLESWAKWGTANLRPIDEVSFETALRKLAKVLPLDSVDPPVPQCRSRRVLYPSTNNAKATCACAKPRIIYVARGTFDLGPVICGQCESLFTIRDED